MLEKVQSISFKQIVVNEMKCSPEKVVENRLELLSKPEEFDRLYNLLHAALLKKKFSIENIRTILLCVDEAFANAVIWGNRKNAAKKVVVRYYVSKELCAVAVEDQGEGFELDASVNPQLDKDLLKPSGRGLFFINTYIDRVIYNSRGNQIVLIQYNK